mgnify:CR=1 FL=1
MASTEETPIKQEAEAPTEETPAQEPQSSLETAQVDGAGAPAKGADLVDTTYKVEVKLADLQADPNNPLFSATSFEELQL